MEVLMMAKAFAPLVKDMMAKDNIDLEKEINNLGLLDGSLKYNIESISKFYSTYLDCDSIEKIVSNESQCVVDLLSLMALIQSSVSNFQYAALGKYVSIAFENVNNELEKLVISVSYEQASNKDKKKLAKKGKEENFTLVKNSIFTLIAILKTHQENWAALLTNVKNDATITPNKLRLSDSE